MKEFKKICKEAFDIESETSDCKSYEHKLVKLLNLCRENLSNKAVFSKLFIQITQGKLKAPQGTVGFCMRELRYPEVLEHVKEQKKLETSNYLNNLGEYRSIIEAYESANWDDADFWQYYS